MITFRPFRCRLLVAWTRGGGGYAVQYRDNGGKRFVGRGGGGAFVQADLPETPPLGPREPQTGGSGHPTARHSK